MNVYVPFTHIQIATRVALRQTAYIPVEITPEYSYIDYFEDRWADRVSFINVEHDVVPWPGALQELWDCSYDWCAFGYHTNDTFADHYRTLFPYIGCVKFSQFFIDALPKAWVDAEDWLVLDRHIAAYARAHGFEVHQHFPAVVNANPVLVGG